MKLSKPIDKVHTPAAIERWLNTANPGDVAEYHRGATLWHDGPGLGASLVRPPDGSTREIRTPTANVTSTAYEIGAVTLFQRHNGPYDFSYLMQARNPKKGKR